MLRFISMFKSDTPIAFDPEKSFDVLYPGQCQKITIEQNNNLIVLKFKKSISKQPGKRDMAVLESSFQQHF